MPSVHRATFVALVNQHGWTTGAELGVDKGILFGMLLRECPQLQLLIGVDTFPDHERSRRAFEYEDQYGQALLQHMTTREASALVAPRSLDFVFIDADHSEASVAEDIRLWKPKVSPGGWLGGHDYSRKFPGVIAAVDRAFGSSVRRWPGDIWGVWR